MIPSTLNINKHEEYHFKFPFIVNMHTTHTYYSLHTYIHTYVHTRADLQTRSLEVVQLDDTYNPEGHRLQSEDSTGPTKF